MKIRSPRNSVAKILWFASKKPSLLRKLVKIKGADLILEVLKRRGKSANRALRILLENGANPLEMKRTTECIVIPIISAVIYENVTAFSTLCDYIGDIRNAKILGKPLLRYILTRYQGKNRRLDSKFVEILASKGVSVNVINPSGYGASSLHIAKSYTMWALAEAGARYDLTARFISKINRAYTFKCTPLEHFIHEDLVDFRQPHFVGVSHRLLRVLCVMLAIGDTLNDIPNGYDLALDAIVVSTVGYRTCQVIMDSGYRVKDLEEVCRKLPLLTPAALLFQRKYSGPLSLQKLAANVVRRQLRPNAVAGARELMNKGEVPKNMLSLTLGLTKEDLFAVPKRFWCGCTWERNYCKLLKLQNPVPLPVYVLF